MTVYTTFLLCLVWAFCSTSSADLKNGTSDLIENLLKRIQKLQVKKSTDFIPLIQEQKEKGVYESYIKVNLHGPPNVAIVREDLEVFDNNMFVTSWISMCLLEAHKYGVAPPPSSEQLTLALEAINNYKDMNKPYRNSIMVFWPQVYNSTVSTYQSTPQNLINIYKLMDHLPLKGIEDLLKWLGLDYVEHVVEEIMSLEGVFLNAFRIPPDFDDTFVNLGLGSLLTGLKSEFPKEHDIWARANDNLTSVFDALKYYAYRPFSNESRINTVDPRTYFYLRHFLEKAKTSGQDLALVPTWIQDINETRTMYYRGDVMPFNINNVDVTVSANAIYGITAGILSGVLKPEILDDPEVQKIYLNTTAMVAYEIQTNLTNRRDLAQTYYPSLFEFYWFVARTLCILTSRSQTGPLPHKALETVMWELSGTLRSSMTVDILSAGKTIGDEMYFDDFLGDGDLTNDNKTLNRAEDRIFTTAMAVNALIQTWAVFDDTQNKMFWITQTSPDVKDVVKRSVAWLESNTLSGHYKPWNVFFSGSGKGHATMPFWYPVNRMEYLNGTKIPDDKHFPSYPFIMGFQGVVSESTYLHMCNETHFGEKTPMTFPGFNAGNGYFPFWTSDAYTYASTILALSQYNNLHDY